MIAVKDTLEGKDHIIRVQLARWGKPRRALESDIIAQVEAVGRAVIQHFPAFRQLRHQAVGIRVDIQQAVVKLRGKGIDNQAAARFCGLKVSTWPLTQ
jgi:hypothetical protein